LLCVVLFLPAAAFAEPPVEDGFRSEPHLGFSHGDHQVDLGVQFRYRWEAWKAFAPAWDAFSGVRTRLSLDYRFRDTFRLFAQGQQTAVLGLGADASGAGALYRSNNGSKTNPWSVRPSQLFAELTPNEDITLRGGREYVNLGTQVAHEEPNWNFLQNQRLADRLMGSVDWTDGARAFDGGTAHVVLGGHHVYAFLNQPTTGVFVVDDEAYGYQRGIIAGGIEWTAPPGTLLKDTQLGAFFLGYSDTRNPQDVTGLFGDIEVYTLGGSWLGVYPLGPGRIDALLWGALQVGSYVDQGPPGVIRRRDQLAGAVLAEFGYQLPDVWSKPWVRVGVNYGSGDSDPNDDDRNTFVNILPTNHLYYGYTDQLALQNLIDLLVQLKLEPVWKLGLEITYHRFWLQESADFRWAGTGAFSRSNLGFVRNPSNGSTDVGHELDVVATLPIHKAVGLQVGYARLWGGSVFAAQAQSNVSFGYAMVTFSY
jgi:hypothetical protein